MAGRVGAPVVRRAGGIVQARERLVLGRRPWVGRLGGLAGLLLAAPPLLQLLVAGLGVLPVRLQHQRPAQVVGGPAHLAVDPPRAAGELGELVGTHHQQHHQGHEEDLADAEAEHVPPGSRGDAPTPSRRVARVPGWGEGARPGPTGQVRPV